MQLEASGTRGDVLILWDSKTWKGEVLKVGAYTLTCRFKSTINDFGWHMTRVYAPNCNQEWQEVWWEIGSVRSLFTGPRVIGVILILLDMLQSGRIAPEPLHTKLNFLILLSTWS